MNTSSKWIAGRRRLERVIADAIIRFALWLPGDSREVLSEGFIVNLTSRMAVLTSSADREALIAAAEDRWEGVLGLPAGTIRRRLTAD